MTSGASPVWHPFTQHGLGVEPPVVVRAKGVWLETDDGRRILDAISSWWVTTHGHGHPRIAEAIAEAAGALDQIIFAGLTHQHAEDVARRLVALAPKGLSHVFFSDSGSTSVEVALKMALGYWRNIGAPRTRIVALEHGYHGDTVGAMSAGARGVFSASYEPLLFDVARIPFPAAECEQATLDALDAECRRSPVAALIVEPLLLGAGGMLIYSARVLTEMKRICERHGALLIADEVMTGWGRTGTLFACEQAGVAPDIMCVAKGITGGALPLAATLASPEIFEAHRSPDRAKMLFHSSSYTANPIACAAAAANLDVWAQEPVLDRVRTLAERQERHIARLRSVSGIADARVLGTVGVIDLATADAGYLADVAPRLMQRFMSRGLLIRPLGNTVYVMPPYCIGGDELDMVWRAVEEECCSGG